MRKLSLIIVAVTVVIAFTGMQSKGEAAEIYGCFKKNNGQLRIVSSSGKCLPSEKQIVLNQSNDGRYEFVGFSTAKSNGAAGILKLHQLCQADFPNSRTCGSIEILKTVNVPSSTGTGWVQPVFPGGPAGLGNGIDTVATDASGIETTSEGMTCSGWSNSSEYGLTVSTDGKFSTRSCSEVLSAACCAL
jgi:hypothetical protein